MWQSINDEKVKYNNEQLEREILLNWKQIFFLDGPSRCGKTYFLKHLNSENTLMLPLCNVIEELIEYIKRREPLQKYYNDMDRRFACKILCLEDIDLSLAGKASTQKEIAYLLKRLSQNRKIILTGIQIDQRCGGLLRSLGTTNFDYFRYVE